MPDDVTHAQLDRQAQLWRALGPERQYAIAAQQWVAGRRAAELSVRARHRDASEALVDWLVRAMFVGDAVAARLYGPRPAR
jgi:hypothetical protein